jgi:maleylacetate reductase
MMEAFQLVTYAREIIFGPGAVDQLPGAVERFGWQRLMVCASPSLKHNGVIQILRDSLGSRLVAVYDQVKAHVPDFQVQEALAMAEESQAQVIIGLGGGSPIGMAKAVSMRLEAGLTGKPARAAFPTDQPMFPVIGIPTTYAGSEITPIYGVTYNGQGKSGKITYRDPKITPKLVIYDPDLTLSLPREVTASSGINALAHCVEALYSIGRNPQASAFAQQGIRHIVKALPVCTAEGPDRRARGEMLLGSHLAALALSTTKMGLHHELCHVLGGSAHVPHGVANSVMLPHAMRFNLEAAAPQIAQAARAMGIEIVDDRQAAEAGVDRVYQFIGGLGLAQRLREVGVDEAQIPRLAELALESKAVQNNPKPVTHAAQAESVLRAAW